MNNYISKENTNKILSATEDRLIDTVQSFSELKRSGSSYLTTCPVCGSDNSLNINVGKKLFKCFKCNDFAGKKPIDYLMKGQGMDFPTALRWLSDRFGIILLDNAPVASKDTKKATISKSRTFCEQMLKESGLTKDDVTATVFNAIDDKHTVFKQQTFIPGTLLPNGDIDPKGDDVIIKYFDLEGYPVTFIQKDPKGKIINAEKPFYRIRYQYPDAHMDKNGRAAKYKSPYGAPNNIYIPQAIRSAYKKREIVERLYIQEGEKKAEKACKHGILSIAVAGIQNIGMNRQLPESIIKIVEGCQVKEIVFLLDSDCFDITKNIRINEPIERRPLNFFYAVRNYKEYFESLRNRNIFLDLYFGHVLKNENDDKGVDDLLTNSLLGKEPELLEDLNTTINLKDKVGKHVQLYKITTLDEYRIKQIWNLQSPQTFCKLYKEQLIDLPEFKFGKNKWRYNESGELESASTIDPNEQYWKEIVKKDREGNIINTTYEFKHVESLIFLRNRGFGRYRRLDGESEFVHIEHPFVKTVKHYDIRDYIDQFTEDTQKRAILEMIYKGGLQYFGPDRLSRLKYFNPVWEVPARGMQYLYFRDKYWLVTKDAIIEQGYEQIPHNIWLEQKKDTPATLLDNLFTVISNDDTLSISLTTLGKKCDFLRFLENTSNFTWRKKSSDITDLDRSENQQHLIAKLCAIGYLVLTVKDYGVAKAVVGVDGKQSDIGVSNGRSGKSIIGELVRRVLVAQYINGKSVDLARDQFVWTEVTEKTKVVFIDDVKKNFNFELLFANITGSWNINYKSGGRVTLDFNKSPKVYLTTNHAISGEGSSFLDRQWSIAFSDFYNDKHKPIDDFGCLFFEEWDFEQWNLTWNLIAQCIKLYLTIGVVESPSERIEQRRLKQDIGEAFIQWADEYYSDLDHINNRLVRKTLHDSLLAFVGKDEAKYYPATVFKKKLVSYAQFKGYTFNPNRYNNDGTPIKVDKDGKPDLEDKSGGVEYFTIGNEQYGLMAGGNLNIFAELDNE